MQKDSHPHASIDGNGSVALHAEMAHWKLTLAYDGTAFHGWQVQPGLPTIQGSVSQALAQITGEALLPQGSGRTDAGVHALAQVCSFSLRSPFPAANLKRALNRILVPAIRILSAVEIDASFHARHSARRKTYEYRVFEGRSIGDGAHAGERVCSPFLAPLVWDVHWPLDLDKMQQAARLFCGRHNFTSFAASDPEKNIRETDTSANTASGPPLFAHIEPVRTIFSSAWEQREDLLIYRVAGDGFLHHMVRNLVGTMVDVGRGRFDPEVIPAMLKARSRSSAGPTAPARGLYLHSVEYGPERLEDPAP